MKFTNVIRFTINELMFGI